MPATTLDRPVPKSADTTKAATLLTAAELDLMTVLNAVKKAIANVPKGASLVENAAAEKLLHEVLGPLMMANLDALQKLDKVRAEVLIR